MVSGSFNVTKALCWISHLAFTIIGMLRQAAFKRDLKRFRLKRLRLILFTAIGWFVEHSRQKHFKIALTRVGSLRFHALMQRIWAF